MGRLIRPMTIEDEQGDSITIDALDVTDFDVLNCMLTIEHQYQEHLHFPSKSTSEIFRMFNAKLYEALNAPVLATKEVLAGLPDEGEFLIQNVKWGCGYIDTDCIYTFKNNRFIDSVFNRSVYNVNVLDELKENSFEIKAKNEIALAYLLQFYTDGTPVVVK